MSDQRALPLDGPFPALRRRGFTTLQVNLGYRCNQRCLHCHVNAGPHRREAMSAETVDAVIELLRGGALQTLDLTGGAPELNPEFRRLVSAARELDVEVIDRCNLTVLFEPGQETLAAFLADQGVTLVASLPCYLEENVDRQRGKGVHGDSIRAIRMLNGLGYGTDERLRLNLVFNPIGPVLPPAQERLEADYRRELGDRFGIVFNRLYVITNMPIGRFGAVLNAKGQMDGYMRLLRAGYSDANLDTLMCRDTVSVDWQGFLYDCDFNQMLRLPMLRDGMRAHIGELRGGTGFHDALIATGDHCFGCTAGQGSSCGGALSDARGTSSNPLILMEDPLDTLPPTRAQEVGMRSGGAARLLGCGAFP